MAALITRDFLSSNSSSSSSHMESQELDLDLQVPNGWEKRLDLKSGKVYLQRCAAQPSPKLQDLNYPPQSYQSGHHNNHYQFVDDSNFLDLKLTSSPSSPPGYQSVCTLDKVKSALERAQREPRKTRSPYRKSPPSSSSSEGETVMVGTPVAAGCPSCLLYVLISKNNPRCPRCNSVVPLPGYRKPQLDLNISM